MLKRTLTTLFAAATLAGCGTFGKAVTLAGGAKLEAGSLKIGADDLELNFDAGLVLQGDTTAIINTVSDYAVGCIAASGISSTGTVTFTLPRKPKTGEYMILKSDAAIAFTYARGAGCGALELRNGGKELWMRTQVGNCVIIR